MNSSNFLRFQFFLKVQPALAYEKRFPNTSHLRIRIWLHRKVVLDFERYTLIFVASKFSLRVALPTGRLEGARKVFPSLGLYTS